MSTSQEKGTQSNDSFISLKKRAELRRMRTKIISFFTIPLISFMAAAGPMVHARADEGNGNGRRDTAQTNNNGDVEQTSENEATTLAVNVSGKNVRHIEGSNFGETNNDFIRNQGLVLVVGSFEADSDDDFGSTATGTWVIVRDSNGVEGAVLARLVGVSEDQLTSFPRYDAVGSGLTLIEDESPEAVAGEEAPTTIEIPEPAGTQDAPINLVEMHEGLPESFSVTIIVDLFDGSSEEIQVNINPDSMLNAPLGILNTSEYPVVQSFRETVEGRIVDFNQAAVSAIFVESRLDQFGTPVAVFAFPVEGTSEWETITLTPGTSTGFYTTQVDSGITESSDELLVRPADETYDNGIIVFGPDGQQINKGDNAIVLFESSEVPGEGLSPGCNDMTPSASVELLQDGGACEITIAGLEGEEGYASSYLGGIMYLNNQEQE